MARPRLSEIRRSQFLDAAIEVIGERGFHATRLEDIAKRVGLHPSTLLHHVSSKDELLADALAQAERRFFTYVRTAVEERDSSVEKLRIVVQCASEPPPGIDDYGLWLDIWSVARTNAIVHATRVQLDQEWRAILEGIIEEGQHKGEIGGPPPDVAALAIAALLDGLAVPMTLKNPGVPPERMRLVAFTVLSRLLGTEFHRAMGRTRERVPTAR